MMIFLRLFHKCLSIYIPYVMSRLVIHIGPFFEQQLRYILISVVSGDMKRGETAFRSYIRIVLILKSISLSLHETRIMHPENPCIFEVNSYFNVAPFASPFLPVICNARKRTYLIIFFHYHQQMKNHHFTMHLNFVMNELTIQVTFFSQASIYEDVKISNCYL